MSYFSSLNIRRVLSVMGRLTLKSGSLLVINLEAMPSMKSIFQIPERYTSVKEER